ncbi:ferritin-like domain-containing protein [Starkeya sp. ORNL1]|uniref:YciE/YciF ferroxidase family protein n=1 Tax=Starkeya sp. ORNL1 TaxID=2709380 RepID=UPI001463613F|nr:ferritin-like domain-containing protein [Starkeya sp. ORNL1]QJP13484.1 ferritin-like domain-containing protein [Starkeya sp. ORNL1]
MKDLNDLFVHLLKDVYYAEKQILKALPKMAKAAQTPELKKAFETHREETEGQVERLQQVFEMMNKPARGVKCDAIEGLVDEAKEVMEEAEAPEVMDAGLLASAQAVEHYEMARYGTLIAWAGQLKMPEAAKLFEANLAQEKNADKVLTELALRSVNRKAA